MNSLKLDCLAFKPSSSSEFSVILNILNLSALVPPSIKWGYNKTCFHGVIVKYGLVTV